MTGNVIPRVSKKKRDSVNDGQNKRRQQSRHMCTVHCGRQMVDGEMRDKADDQTALPLIFLSYPVCPFFSPLYI